MTTHEALFGFLRDILSQGKKRHFAKWRFEE